MKKAAMKMFTVILVLVILLLLPEIFLRIFFPQVFPVHPAGMYTEDQKVGYVLTPGFSGVLQRAEFQTKIEINSMGLRGKEAEPDTSQFGILISGDSQVFGFGVEETLTVAAQLESGLAKIFPSRVFRVFNGGVPGYGTVDQFHFLEKYLPIIKPKLVILQFLPVNDFEENRAPAKNRVEVENGMLKYSDESGSQPVSIPWWKNAQYWLKNNFHLARFVSDRAGFIFIKNGWTSNFDAMWGEDFSNQDSLITTEALAAINNLCRTTNTDFMILYTQGQGFIINDSGLTHPRSFKLLDTFGKNKDVEVINTIPALRRSGNRGALYYPLDGHWTAEGHQVIAEIIIKHIETNYSGKHRNKAEQ